MHTTVLDNDVRIHYDGGDLGGRVIIRYPDGREIATSWDQIAGIGQLVDACKLSIEWLDSVCDLKEEGISTPEGRSAHRQILAALAPYEASICARPQNDPYCQRRQNGLVRQDEVEGQ